MNAEQVNPELEFKRLYAYASGLYPSDKTRDDSIPSYWGLLKRYPMPVLREAFRRACTSSPQFFPSAVRVRECAEAASKSATLARPDYSRPALPEGREFVPALGAGHEEWIAQGANDGERLARLWQVESKHHGWDRGGHMPHEIGARRFQELSKLLDKVGSRTAPTSGRRSTVSDSQSPATGSSTSPRSSESSAARLSHGEGCVCELCFGGVMQRAVEAGVVR